MTKKQGHPVSGKRLRSIWNMAIQDASPKEASVARAKLADGGYQVYMGEDNPIGPAIAVDARIFNKFEDYQKWHNMRETGTFCPGCKHSEYQHVAAQCYTCGYCGWSVVNGNWFKGL